MSDDSDSCPHCKVRSPVKHPLPDNMQQCVECKFTFLESYQDTEITPDTPTPSTTPDKSGRGSRNPDNTEQLDNDKSVLEVSNAAKSPDVPKSRPEQLDFASAYSEEGQQIKTAPSNLASRPSLSKASAVEFSGIPSAPINVQVIRRRKPVQQDSEDKQIGSTALSTATPPHAPQIPANYLEFLHVAYMVVLFGLPDRYRRDVPQPQDLGGNGDGARRTYKRWITEWTQMGGIAGILFGVLFTVLQISSAAYDPIVRTIVQLAIISLLFGAVYAFILSMAFGKLEAEPEELDWTRQTTGLSAKKILWNPWIMLSMPLAWIIW
ncbi:hypothetical protein DFH09DRAFT_81940 [Mycena vulgaris]|nr:hypothetical protein DFH09DRAFT_81940 [Mycena vulgaris]